jgi:putative transposase
MPYSRKHIRLPGRNYTEGIYFVTLCANARTNIFGRIIGQDADVQMELNTTGRIVDECWRAIPDHFAHARIDEMQIMPDHVQAIVTLSPPVTATRWVAPSGAKGPQRGSLGAIIGAFKSETTKRLNRIVGITGQRLWQAGYYERTIRRQGNEYGRIAQYIADNPANWR